MTQKDINLRVLLALEKKNELCPIFFNNKEKEYLQSSRVGLI